MAGCTTNIGETQFAQGEIIEIGGLFALTGYGAVIGEDERRAVELAIHERNEQGGIQGRQIRLRVEDTQTTPAEAVSGYRSLRNRGIDIFIGPTWEANTQAIVPLAAQEEVLLVSPSSYLSVYMKNSPTTFATYPPYEYEIHALQGYFAEQGLDTFAIIYNEEFFGTIMKDLFVQTAQEEGWSITGVHASPEADNDFRTQLQRVVSTGAQAIYAPLDYPALDNLARQAMQLGINLPIIALATAENPREAQQHAEVLEGIIYAYPVDTPEHKNFRERFHKMFGEEPTDLSAAAAYDSASMVFDAMSQGANTPQEIAAYLQGLREYQGASNTITFTPEGIVRQKEYRVKTIQNGTFVAIG